MITGFNTDIEYQGVTYHVQTEDKGTATPLILSLVYDGGTILASKRSPYDDLLLETFDEKVLAERLQRQHKLICAAISSGRIEDLKRMSMKPSAKEKPQSIVEKTVEKIPEKVGLPKIELSTETIFVEKPKPEKQKPEKPKPEKQKPKTGDIPQLDIPQPQLLKEKADAVEDLLAEQTSVDLEQILDEERLEAERRAAIPKPKPKIWETEIKSPDEEIIIEAVEIIEDVEIISADAVEIVEEKTPSQKLIEDLSRMQNAAEYDPTSSELKIKILNDEEIYSGDEKNLKIIVFRGSPRNILGGTHIMVKVLGTAFSPMLFHAKTDEQGIAAVHLKLPVFDHGRAVVLIKAMSEGDEAEFRRIVKMR